MKLSEYPYDVVRLACTKCGRQGQYRLARLADKYGSEILLPYLLEQLVDECSKRGKSSRTYDYCGAHFVDMKGQRPPDLPPNGSPGIRLVA